MKHRDLNRPSATLLASFAALAVAVGLASCGSSDASGVTAVPAPSAAVTVPVSEPAPTSTAPAATTTTVVVVTSPPAPPATEAAPTTTNNIVVVTDAEVADLEKQLDEIDQLLSGVDADLSQD